jgi:hypothetical protein
MTPDRNRPDGEYGRAVGPTTAKRLTALTAKLESLRTPAQAEPDTDARELKQLVRQMTDVLERFKANGGTTALDPELVFVITSFDDHLEPAFQAIKEAAERTQLRAERLKDAQGDFRISEMIDRKIDVARLIVADLTLESQNVYYELGVARGRHKTVVTIAREGTTVHFNAQDWNTIFYNDSRTLEEVLFERFRYELTTDMTERWP